VPSDAGQEMAGANAKKDPGIHGRKKIRDLSSRPGVRYTGSRRKRAEVTVNVFLYAQGIPLASEVRHGPRSIAGGRTHLSISLFRGGCRSGDVLVKELEGAGRGNLCDCESRNAGAQKHSDLLIELSLDGPEFARYAVVTAIPAHLMGNSNRLPPRATPDRTKNLKRGRWSGASNGQPTAKRERW